MDIETDATAWATAHFGGAEWGTPAAQKARAADGGDEPKPGRARGPTAGTFGTRAPPTLRYCACRTRPTWTSRAASGSAV